MSSIGPWWWVSSFQWDRHWQVAVKSSNPSISIFMWKKMKSWITSNVSLLKRICKQLSNQKMVLTFKDTPTSFANPININPHVHLSLYTTIPIADTSYIIYYTYIHTILWYINDKDTIYHIYPSSYYQLSNSASSLTYKTIYKSTSMAHPKSTMALFLRNLLSLLLVSLFSCLLTSSLVSSHSRYYTPPSVSRLTDLFPHVPISNGYSTGFGGSNVKLINNGSMATISLTKESGEEPWLHYT